MIAQAALSRQTIAEHQRRPFFVCVDEFSSFTTDAVAGMLSELRKFKIGLVLAAQFTGQLSTKTLESVLGNVGTIIALRLGASDAPLISRVFGGINPIDLISLPNHHAYIRLMVEGVQTKGFSMRLSYLP